MTPDPRRRPHENVADAFGDELPADADELARLAGLVSEPVELEAPPAPLWDRISSELGIDRRDESPPPARRPAPSRALAPTAISSPTPLAGRRRPRLPLLAAAAVAVVAALVSFTLLGSDEVGRGTIETALTALPAHPGAQGTARVVVEADRTFVDYDLQGIEVPEGADLELWLLDPEVETVVSLGRVADVSGWALVPTDVDLGATPIVDISLEPRDGDPAHSGDSVVRGTLPT